MSGNQTIKLTPQELRAQSQALEQISEQYRSVLRNTDRVLKRVNSNWSYRLANNFATKIHSVSKASENLVTMLAQSAEAARSAGESFTTVDAQLAKYVGGETGEKSGQTQATTPANNDIEWEGSWKNGNIKRNGSIFGFDASGELEGDLFGGKVDTFKKATWDTEDGDVGIGAGISAEGYAAKGSARWNIGLLNREINGKVGTVSGKGKIGATLFEDGKLSPALEAEIKGKAALLEGDAKTSFGTEDYNAHIKGSGTVLGAEAEAGVKAGKITYTDKATGTTKTKYGVQGEASAEAYIAQGKVSGGVTIFGIDIDVGVSGKAGGAGVSVGGGASTNGVSGKIGAGLGLGLGLEVEIDWSDFSWDKLRFW